MSGPYTSGNCTLVVSLNLCFWFFVLSRFSDLLLLIFSELVYGPSKNSQLGGRKFTNIFLT
jgi:hypothetical protein